MQFKQSVALARQQSRAVSKAQFKGVVTDLFEAAEGAVPRPQAFLVEQTSNWTLPTHFHVQNQFQVFVAGSGHIGKNLLKPLTIHYSSPHTGYGPLISGDEGVSYLTLRAMSDVGAWYLPEARESLLVRIKKQQAHGAPSTLVTAEQLLALVEAHQEPLIAMDSGGLAAWLVRLPPGAQRAAPLGAELGGGRFYVVTQGGLIANGDALPSLAVMFVSVDETVDLLAGADGLEVMILQFPSVALLPLD
ncbi:hypothetical protein ACVBEH_01805 [Roseateles sp. GG27B]